MGVEAAFITPVSQREAIEMVTTFEDVLEEMHRFTEPQRVLFMTAVRKSDSAPIHALVDQAFFNVGTRRMGNQK